MNWERYERQIILPEVGLEGQRRIEAARVLIVGVGGLGCPAALFLAAAGVGTLGLADPDQVHISNLHRQVLFGDGDIGRMKVEAGRDRLMSMAPGTHCVLHPQALTAENALDWVTQFDVVLDCTDNYLARYVLNDACVDAGKPLVGAAVYRFEAQVSVFAMPDGPCYRCLFPQPPGSEGAPNCADSGVLGVLPGLAGTLQASECLKIVLGVGDVLSGRLLIFDTLKGTMRTLRAGRNPNCPGCGDGDRSARSLAISACQNPAMPSVPSLTVQALAAELASDDPPQILDVRQPHELEVSALPGVTLIPLGELPTRWPELDANTRWVVLCRSGQRSGEATAFLLRHGFRDVRNITGGINAYAREVDSSLPVY